MFWFRLLNIDEASDMTAYIQVILDCGYIGKVEMENKENILRY